jgi:hypothetical protein
LGKLFNVEREEDNNKVLGTDLKIITENLNNETKKSDKLSIELTNMKIELKEKVND